MPQLRRNSSCCWFITTSSFSHDPLLHFAFFGSSLLHQLLFPCRYNHSLVFHTPCPSLVASTRGQCLRTVVNDPSTAALLVSCLLAYSSSTFCSIRLFKGTWAFLLALLAKHANHPESRACFQPFPEQKTTCANRPPSVHTTDQNTTFCWQYC